MQERSLRLECPELLEELCLCWLSLRSTEFAAFGTSCGIARGKTRDMCVGCEARSRVLVAGGE